MMIVLRTRGTLDVNVTQLIFRHNWEHFAMRRGVNVGKQNFGAGYEFAFTCVKCKRVLPLALSEADHIIPKISLTKMIEEDRFSSHCGFYQPPGSSQYKISRTGTLDFFFANDYSLSPIQERQKYEVDITNQSIKLETANGNFSINIDQMLKNDIDNLQVLCPICNKVKGVSIP